MCMQTVIMGKGFTGPDGNLPESGCEISTGPGTNASELLVGPVKNYVYFQLN